MYTLPPIRAINVFEYLVFRNADDKARDKIRGQLDMPLSGDPDDAEDGVWSDEAMGAAFDAAADAL